MWKVSWSTPATPAWMVLPIFCAAELWEKVSEPVRSRIQSVSARSGTCRGGRVWGAEYHSRKPCVDARSRRRWKPWCACPTSAHEMKLRHGKCHARSPATYRHVRDGEPLTLRKTSREFTATTRCNAGHCCRNRLKKKRNCMQRGTKRCVSKCHNSVCVLILDANPRQWFYYLYHCTYCHTLGREMKFYQRLKLQVSRGRRWILLPRHSWPGRLSFRSFVARNKTMIMSMSGSTSILMLCLLA